MIVLPTPDPNANTLPDNLDIDLIKEKLSDHRWRLSHLYYVRDKSGKKVPFTPNETQLYVMENLWYMNVITKARQLGMTTFFSLFYLDQILWNENKIAGIVAHKQEDMKRIFRGKILFALNHLHPWIKEMIGAPVVDTANEIVFGNGGGIFVSLSTRGQTPNFLHISEFGYICAHDPAKSKEIIEGAINSVDAGQMVSIESTAAGRQGYFYEIVMRAEQMRKRNEKLTPLDFKSFFFPWWMDPKYSLPDVEHVVLDKENKEYFENLERMHGITLTQGQKVWYSKKKETNRDGMLTEFPSTIDEAFSVSLEGAYYAKDVMQVYRDQRIGFFPYDPKYLVDVAWDLGMNDDNVLIFFQCIGEEIRIIDHYSSSNEGLEHYVKHLSEKPYRYGRHILPHDAAVRDLTIGMAREQFLWGLGVRNTVVMPRASQQDGIEKVRSVFRRFRFHEENTKVVLEALQAYRREFDSNHGVWKSTPFHGPESHIADAVRQLAMAVGDGEMFDPENSVSGKSPIRIETFQF